jgi:type III pantothenate kinase
MQWLEREPSADLLRDAIGQADEVWLSNVAGERWLQALPAIPDTFHVVQSTASALGVRNHYTVPLQLGSDRWCSILAVWQHYARSALVVTAGTAMTIDALNLGNEGADFLGGSIQPGLRLMWQSLQQGAAQLDYAYPENIKPDGFALNSQQAMWLGCVQAMTAALVAQYSRLSEMTANAPLLILSGGDAQLLHRYLPHTLSAQAIIVDNLVLKGLACLARNTHK